MAVKKLDLDLIPQVKSQSLRAKRKVLSRTLEGTWTAMLKGRGMEFAGFRRYTSSDDASRIDWGASLRSKETLVREFEEYKNVNVLFMLDVSNTMLFSSGKKLKAERAAEIVFNAAMSILDNGDSVGYVMFSDTVVAKEMPSIGRGIVYSMASAFQNPHHYGGKRDFSRVVNTVSAMMKQRVLVILVSDFLGLDEGWERYIKLLSEKFDLIGIMIRDPRDTEFPDTGSQILLEDPFSDEKMLVDVKDLKDVFGIAAKEGDAYIAGVFEAAKAGLVRIDVSAEDMLTPLLQYFRRRAAIIK